MKKIHLIIATSLALGIFSGCTTNRATLDSPDTSTKESIRQNQTTSQSSNQTTTESTTNNRASEQKITLDQAINIYQEQYPNTDITKIDIESYRDSVRFEITGVDNDREYEIFIAADGSYKKGREEALDADEKNDAERNSEKLNLEKLLSLEGINQIALQEAGDGTISEWSLERELSTTFWEVTVITKQQEISVSIDAQSGEVLETEVDD